MADKKQTVLIVIPAYNEGPHIARVVTSIPHKLSVGTKQFNAKVVVVEDGSKDNTAQEAAKAGAIVLRHVVNAGAGAATRTGLRYAEQHSDGLAYVVTIDGDGQHASADIQKLITYAVKHTSDMIVGNRLHTNNKKNIPFQRRLGNWGLSLIGRVLFGIKTKDTQSGLRLYSARVIPKISYYTLDRYGFCTETLWYAVRNQVKVDEVPIAVNYSKEGIARGQSAWGVVELLRDLLRIRMAG